jgi:hypothetical protein
MEGKAFKMFPDLSLTQNYHYTLIDERTLEEKTCMASTDKDALTSFIKELNIPLEFNENASRYRIEKHQIALNGLVASMALSVLFAK